MKKLNTLLLVLLLCFCSSSLLAQNTSTTYENVDVQVTYAQRIGKTLPIRHLVPMNMADPEKRKRVKLNKKAPANFGGRGKYVPANPNALPQGDDAVWQRSMRSSNIDIEPLVNIEGLATGASPQDPTGDIGRDYYVQAVNATLIGVFKKDGSLITTFTANTIWNSIGFSSIGDPIILYDQDAERWIITELASGNQMLVGISETGDPLGSYIAYNFGAPSLPDYPKYGIWSNAYSITTSEDGASSLSNYFLNRADLLAGASTVMIQRIIIPGIGSGPGFQVATPVDWTGMTPPAEDRPIMVSLNDDAWGGAAEDRIDVHTFDIDWDDSANTMITTTSIVTSPYDTNPCLGPDGGSVFNCMPQLNGPNIDGVREIIMNQVHYRNFGSHESIVLNFITDVTGGDNLSGIRWMELRRTGGGDWELYQEGTFAPGAEGNGIHRFVGGICMDGAGNIGLAYAVSSEDMYVGLRFTGRRASDPLGEMTVNEFVVVEGQATINSFRFADYAHMSVDPTNDRTFWYTNEYGGPNGKATRIVAFELSKDTTDIAPVDLTKPASASLLSDAETVEVVVRNSGLDTAEVFQVGYIFEEGVPVIEDVTFELLPDSTYTHTFGTTVDMSIIGDYDFTIFTSLEGDQAIFNDTLRVVRSHLPRFDVAVINIEGLDQLNCGDELLAGVLITNLGTETLTSLTIEMVLNGNVISTFEWTGELLPGESETIGITITDMVNGANEVTINASMPNGEIDEMADNNSFSRPFDAITEGVAIFLQLNTDDYPSETTWELSSEEGDILYSGGPYDQESSLIIEEFCLDEEACFIFTIFDVFGDGICCEYGDGNYSIVDENGAPLLVSDGVFTSSETNNFCATFVCLLEAEAAISPESSNGANDGVIMINPSNGTAPYQFSIDGGTTFQTDDFFGGLSAGSYDIVVIDGSGCDFETTVTVSLCAMDVMAEIIDESEPDSADAVISITVLNGTEPFLYSIDGGETFQESPVFEGLMSGEYTIVVEDAIGCEFELEVVVGLINSTDNTTLVGQSIEVFPNPTDGIFRINIRGLKQTNYLLPIEIFDAKGQRVQSSNLAKYNDLFTGTLSLYAYPDGIYYVRFNSREINRMVRIVKQ
jgi:hypothetical protein